MLEAGTSFPVPLPDDPGKWNGWSKYNSPNPYERLCLDPRGNPSDQEIDAHWRELLRWWQKKLPLKTQPSNPLTQLLGRGLDESSRYLTEARMELLNPDRRRQVDAELAAQAQEQAVAEFHKYLTFSIADGVLTPEEERSLFRFGRQHQLTDTQMQSYIDAELHDSGAKRAPAAGAAVAPAPAAAPAARLAKPRDASSPQEDFVRMLRLTGLDSAGISSDTREAFISMGENLGIDEEEVERLLDAYLDEADETALAPVAPAAPVVAPAKPAPAAPAAARSSPPPESVATGSAPPFVNSLGMQMVFVPSGQFVMGSQAIDAGPTESPLTRVTLSSFLMSRFPVTNEEFEAFDPSHVRKRSPGAGPRHPAVYVSSVEAMKFCQWLAARERKRYRLPTEAEWEYAARGTDGRKYPWGSHDRGGDLANFADKNTVFAWSDREIDDGFPESSPVGSFPLGASPFGLEDMAGNVWEWCFDFFEPYRGAPKVNPRGSTSGAKRVYRGGSWKSRFNSLRTTARGSNAPNYSCNDLGFRIVCECD